MNLSKSRLYGVEVSTRVVRCLALGLKCSFGETPFMYLGLPIGDRMWRVDVINSKNDYVNGKQNQCHTVVS